jgi:hypothetical protein
MATALPTVWLHGRLKAVIKEKVAPLIESDLFSSGSMELNVRTHSRVFTRRRH